MLRAVVLWASGTLAGLFAVGAKVVRDHDIALVSLGLAVLCFVMWLYVLSTRSAPRDPNRASVFRLVSLWMKAKERDLEARVNQKP